MAPLHLEKALQHSQEAAGCDMGSPTQADNTPFDILTYDGSVIGNYSYDGIQTFECMEMDVQKALSCTNGLNDNGDGLQIAMTQCVVPI